MEEIGTVTSVIIAGLLVWLFCAFLVERLTEGTLHILPFLDKRKLLGCDMPVILAFIYALVVCYGVGLNLFAMFNIQFKWTWAGILLCAIITTKGSSGAHPVIKRWFKIQAYATNPETAFGPTPPAK